MASFSLLFTPKPINGSAWLENSLDAALLPVSVLQKLHTVTRLLVGRMLVNQEQKEPDIVALSWCSEASNTYQSELHLHLGLSTQARNH